LGVSEVSYSLIKMLVALAETMEVDLLAEGIEEPEQFEILTALGVPSLPNQCRLQKHWRFLSHV
jgi:EAL domain-containing protein (putative c-di-GMP-specific phosphodiesterase class I)